MLSRAIFTFLVVPACGYRVVNRGTAVEMDSEVEDVGNDRDMLRLVNQERAKVRKGNLQWSNHLANAARVFASELNSGWNGGSDGHTGRNGSTIATRVGLDGRKWQAVAENQLKGASSLQNAVSRWMGSSGHRCNIQDCKGRGYNQFGFAKVGSAFVQVFGKSPRAVEMDSESEDLGNDRDMLRLVNQERSKVRKGNLNWSNHLATAARVFASELNSGWNGGSDGHTGRNGSTIATRVGLDGRAWQAVAENQLKGASSLQNAVSRWMGSSGHRCNIQDCKNRNYNQFGFAKVGSAFVQVFGRSR